MRSPEKIQDGGNPEENLEVDKELHSAIRGHEEWVEQLRKEGASDEDIEKVMADGQGPVAELAAERGITMFELLTGRELANYAPEIGKGESGSTTLQVGDAIRLIKRSLKEGNTSMIQEGDVVEGVLEKEISVGEPLYFGSGHTSDVKSVRVENGKTIIETRTSEYEIEPDTPEYKSEALPVRAGDRIIVRKLLVKEGEASRIGIGEIEGMLESDIRPGRSVFYGTGNTSSVQSVRVVGDRIIIETKTSVYEIEKTPSS